MLVSLVGGAYVLVHTRAFNQFVLEKLVQEAQKATGSRVLIRSMEIHSDKLAIDLYGIVIYGKGQGSQSPFFQSDHARVGLKIVSLLRKKVDLRELLLDRPVLDLQVNAKGETNVPTPASSGKPSLNPMITLFNLAIGHLLIHSGQFQYNDRRVPVFIDLRDLRTEASYGVLTGTYKGSVSYDRGRAVVRNFNPIEHGVRLNFTANRSEVDLDPLIVTAGSSRVTTRANLTNYDRPSVQGIYQGTVSTPELARLLKTPELPVGQVDVNGALRYQYLPTRSFLDSTYADGRFSSSRLGLRVAQASTYARFVKGTFSIDKGNLHVPSLEADLLQGHLKAQGDMLNLSGRSSMRVTAVLNGVSLEALASALPAGTYKRLHFAGNANIQAQASWPSHIEDVVAHFYVTIAAAPQQHPASRSIPLNGVLDVRYDGPHDILAFAPSHLQTGNTQISLTGTVTKQSNLSVRTSTTDLREVSALISEISAATGAATGPLDLRGSADFSGQVSGATKDPRLQGRLTASNVQVEGSQWRVVQANVDLASSRLVLENGLLQSALRGQLNFTASVGLNRWSLTPASPLSIHATGTNLSVAALERLAKQRYPVDGTLAANISLEGTKQNPTGRGSLQITKASAWNEPLSNLSLSLDGDGNSINLAAQMQLPAGNVRANLTFFPGTGQYDATADTRGLKLDQIHVVQKRDLGITGLVIASVRGQGSIKDPQLSADIQVSQLHFRDQSISSAEAGLNLAHRHANFTLHSVIAQGNVEAKGDVELGGGYNASVNADVRAFPVGTLLATYISGIPAGVLGQTEIHASLSGPLKDPARVQAHVEIPTFDLAYQSANIELLRPLRLDYRQGIATLQQTELKGTGTDVTLQGVIPLRGSASSFNVTARGTMDLSLLQGFTRSLKSSGRIDLQVASRGDFKNPTVQGQVKIENAYLSSDSSPLGIEGVNGQLNISGRRLDVAQLTGKAGGGTISLQGYMVYGSQPNFNLSLQADSVRLRYPEGLRSVLNCNLRLDGTTAASTLSGQVLIDRLSFTQQFDLASFTSQFNSSVAPSSGSAFEQNMRLNVSVQSAQNLNLASSQVSMQGSANLNITGTAANPIILGRLSLTGGDVFFIGKRFEVKNGTIEFSNPLRTEPVLNLYVETIVQQYDITLNLTGPVERLRTNYTSNPPLPAADVINLLALGKTAAESATTNTPATVGAESVLAQGAAGQVSSKIQKFAGISQLTIDPLATSNTTDPGAQISIQQRVTGNILLTFSSDVTSTQATSVQLQYRTSRQTSVSVLRDQNGGYAVDFRIHRTF